MVLQILNGILTSISKWPIATNAQLSQFSIHKTFHFVQAIQVYGLPSTYKLVLGVARQETTSLST